MPDPGLDGVLLLWASEEHRRWHRLLEEMLEDAKRRRAVQDIKDIVQAEKFAGCRNKQKRKNHY